MIVDMTCASYNGVATSSTSSTTMEFLIGAVFRSVEVEHCLHSISALIIFYFTRSLAVQSLEGADLHP
jgi:hypothetical protein